MMGKSEKLVISSVCDNLVLKFDRYPQSSVQSFLQFSVRENLIFCGKWKISQSGNVIMLKSLENGILNIWESVISKYTSKDIIHIIHHWSRSLKNDNKFCEMCSMKPFNAGDTSLSLRISNWH